MRLTHYRSHAGGIPARGVVRCTRWRSEYPPGWTPATYQNRPAPPLRPKSSSSNVFRVNCPECCGIIARQINGVIRAYGNEVP